MTEVYHLRLLGPVEVTQDGKPVRGFVSRKAVALLGYVIVHNLPLARSHLADLFWPTTSEAHGRGSLSRVVSNLTRLLPGCLQSDYHSVWFQAQTAYWLDITAFEELLGQEDVPALSRAIALYRGDLMANISLDDCPDFSAWLAAEQQHWRQRASHLFHRLVTHHADRREYQRALELGHRWLELEPWQEEAHRQLMLLLTRAGRRSAALSQYETCRRLLAEELVVEPAPETVALYERIRRVEDRPPHNLPAQPTPFVGRKIELANLDRLIREPNCRLLALVGPGGIGKSRLALQAALEVTRSQMALFLHGVFFIPLAAVASAELLPGAIAEILQISLYGTAEPRLKLLNHLRDRELLLLLDNFEQLLPEGAALLVEILEQAPGVKLIVTSRMYLNLRWEWRFPVFGLPVPDLDRGASDAVQVFLNIAQRVHLPFTLSPANQPAVMRICQLVGGMPLGIELAASWVQENSCTSIMREVEHNLDFLKTSFQDVSERHRSLRAVFDYSWGLLSAEEQRVFSRLSVFQGGFSRQAAEQVVGATVVILTALLNKSLLRQNASGRYGMHGLLRQYATEKLAELPGEQDSTQTAHWAYFADFLYQRELRRGGQQKEILGQLAAEIDNVRTAWNWAIEHGRLTEIGRAAEGLSGFFEVRGWFQEGEAVFRAAAETMESRVQVGSVSPDGVAAGRPEGHALGRILSQYGWFCWRLNRFEQAQRVLQKALVFLRYAGPDATLEVGRVLLQLGAVAWYTGAYEPARPFLQESLAIGQTVDDKVLVMNSLQILGFIAEASGEYLEARHRYQAGYEHSWQINDRYGIAVSLICLGHVACLLGEYGEAKRQLEDGLALAQEMEYYIAEALGQHNAGVLAYLTGAWMEAKHLLQQSLRVFEETGDRRFIALARTHLGHTAYAQGEYSEARQHFYSALQVSLEARTRAVALAALVGIAALFQEAGKPDRTVELLSLVLHHPAAEQETKDRAQIFLENLKAQLPPQTFMEAYQRGNALDLERVATEILQEQ